MSDEIQHWWRFQALPALRDYTWYTNVTLRVLAFIPVAGIILGLGMLDNMWNRFWNG